jgi:GT2 family glycosyltransferase
MIKLAVIIPVHNALDYTIKCLKNLYDEINPVLSDSKVVETIVVDDGSTDGTKEWILENYPKVNILQGDGNMWWSGGINVGMQFAMDKLACTHFLWWNNDILTNGQFFPNLFNILVDSTSEEIHGSKIYQLSNRNELWSAGGYFNTKTGKKDMYGRGETNDNYNEPFEVDWFPGMGTIFHRSVYETIGLCDAKHFPQYHGDSDYTFRAKKAGFKLILQPSLVLFNDTANTAKKHEDSFRQLLKSLTHTKSLYNFFIDFNFYRKHATSMFAIKELFKKYFEYIGGFFKWKFLSIFGHKRK